MVSRGLKLAAALALGGIAAIGCVKLEDVQYPCAADAGGTQCPADMVCGLEGRCHGLGDGGYLCTPDTVETYCGPKAQWACGYTGRCVPVGANADIVAPMYPGSYQVSRISPLTSTLPDKVAVSFVAAASNGPGQGVAIQTLSRLDGTQVTQFDRVMFTDKTGSGEAYFESKRALSTVPKSFAASEFMTLLLGGLPDGGSALIGMVSDGDGGLAPLASSELPVDGGSVVLPSYFPFEGERIETADLGGSSLVLAIGAGGYCLTPPSWGAGPLCAAIAAPGGAVDGGAVLVPAFGQPPALPGARDFAIVTPLAALPEFSVLLGSTDGGVSALLDIANVVKSGNPDAGWIPLDFGDAGLADWGRMRARDNLIAVEATDGVGEGTAGIFAFQFIAPPPGQSPSFAISQVLPEPGESTCTCRPGDRLADFHIEDPQSGPAYDFRCVGDGGVEYSGRAARREGPASVPCQYFNPGPDALWSEPKTRWQTTAPGLAAYVGSHGNIWVGTAQVESERSAFLLPDSAPDVLLGDGQALLDFSGQTNSFFASPAFIAHANIGPLTEGTDLGLQRFGDTNTTANAFGTTIEEDSLWGVLGSGWTARYNFDPDAGVAIQIVAEPDPAQGYFIAPPFQAHRLYLPSSGTWSLVMSSFDSIYEADVTRFFADGGTDPSLTPEHFSLKAIPAARIPISSMAATVDPDGGVDQIWALTAAGLYQVQGSPTDRQWSSTLVPTPPGEATRVWIAPSGAVRVGYANGEVVSITSTIPLSLPLPAVGDEVQDFAQYCGDTLALSRTGLFRLQPDPDGGLASWQLFDSACAGLCLGDGGLPLGADGDPGLSLGRLFHLPAASTGDGGQLYLFNRYGAAAEIDAPGCQ